MSTLCLEEEEKIVLPRYNLKDYTNSDVIYQDLFESEILYIKKIISHDGADRDGPKSHIVDLSIIIKVNDEDENENEDFDYIFLNYHKELWYGHSGNDYDFKLDFFCKLSEVKSFYDINHFNKYLKDPMVEEEFVQLYKQKMEEVIAIEALPEVRLKKLLPFYIKSPFLEDVIKKSKIIDISLKQEQGPLYTCRFSQWHYFVKIITETNEKEKEKDYISSIYFLEYVIGKENSDFVLQGDLKLSDVIDIQSLKKYFSIIGGDKDEYNSAFLLKNEEF